MFKLHTWALEPLLRKREVLTYYSLTSVFEGLHFGDYQDITKLISFIIKLRFYKMNKKATQTVDFLNL